MALSSKKAHKVKIKVFDEGEAQRLSAFDNHLFTSVNANKDGYLLNCMVILWAALHHNQLPFSTKIA